MGPDYLIEQIMKGFNEFEGEYGVNPDGGGSWWTKEIKTLLCRIGKMELDCYTCASQVDKAFVCHGEWLFDVTWLKWNDDLYSVPMVAECEWGGRNDIRDDFQKLLIARAAIRLMVCDTGWVENDSQAKETANLLRGWVDAFTGTQPGDTYLLVAWERDRNNQLWHSYRYRISVDDNNVAQLTGPSRLLVGCADT